MRTIWKYPMSLGTGSDWKTYDIPDGIVRHVGVQNREVMLWIEVDPEAKLRRRTFKIVGTGHEEIGEGFVYLGTVGIGPFVWHVYETTWAGDESVSEHPNPSCPRCGGVAVPHRCPAVAGMNSNTAAGSYGDSDMPNKAGGDQ